MYDKMDDNRKIDKIEDFCDKISDTMKGIQIQLERSEKESGDIF